MLEFYSNTKGQGEFQFTSKEGDLFSFGMISKKRMAKIEAAQLEAAKEREALPPSTTI